MLAWIILIFAAPWLFMAGVFWGRRLEKAEGPRDEHIEALMRELRPANEDEYEPPFTF